MPSYIIYDLEGTCWMDGVRRESEIIEIGAVKINEKLEVVDTFQKFIRPTCNPFLSGYCRSLTKITQKDIDDAGNFTAVMNEFIEWLGDEYYLCAWGSDKVIFKKNCQLNNFDMDWLKNNNDIQVQFSKTRRENGQLISLKDAIALMDVKVEGRRHRAIYDALNTAKVFVKIFDELTFEENCSDDIVQKKRRKRRKRYGQQKKKMEELEQLQQEDKNPIII
jgi:3'-5' exoribonuclease 1